jgi:hypothetical protein
LSAGLGMFAKPENPCDSGLYFLRAIRVGTACFLVMLPRLSEAVPLPETKMVNESGGGAVVTFVGSEKKAINSAVVHCAGDGSGGKNIGKCGSKLDAGGDKASVALTGHSELVRDEPRKATSDNSKKPQVAIAEIDSENVHPSIWILFAIIVSPLFGAMPNVK